MAVEDAVGGGGGGDGVGGTLVVDGKVGGSGGDGDGDGPSNFFLYNLYNCTNFVSVQILVHIVQVQINLSEVG